MGRISLLLIDKDYEYISSLSNYIAVNYSHLFTVSFVTPAQFKKNDYNKNTDILLTSREIHEDYPVNSGLVLFFSEDKNVTGYDSIYKFQHCDLLVKKIIDYYTSEKGPFSPINSGMCLCVGIYGPVFDTVNMTLGAGLAARSALKGRNILFFDSDGASVIKIIFKNSCNAFSNVLYRVKDGYPNIGTILDGVTCASDISGLFYLPRAESLLELDEISPEDYVKIVSSLKSLGSYDFIMVNMDSRLDKRNFAILNECDIIFVPFSNNKMETQRLETIKKELDLQEDKNGCRIQENMVPVQLGTDDTSCYPIGNSILGKEVVEFAPKETGSLVDLDYFRNELSHLSGFLDLLLKKYVFPKMEDLE